VLATLDTGFSVVNRIYGEGTIIFQNGIIGP